MRKHTVYVRDKMQKRYRYAPSAPTGRDFDPEFKPQLTPAQMLQLGVFCGKYMTDCRNEFPKSWFAKAKFARGKRGLFTQFFQDRCQSAAVGMETQRLDPSRRSARLVPMVLPLLHGPPAAGGRRTADQTLEGDSPARSANPEELRTWRFAVSPAATSGTTSLGLRQPDDLGGNVRSTNPFT